MYNEARMFNDGDVVVNTENGQLYIVTSGTRDWFVNGDLTHWQVIGNSYEMSIVDILKRRNNKEISNAKDTEL